MRELNYFIKTKKEETLEAFETLFFSWNFNDKLDKKLIVFCLTIDCIKLYCGNVEVNRSFPNIDHSDNAARIVLGLKVMSWDDRIG